MSGDKETSPLGVLIMSYGTPADSSEIEAYYTHIRRGRPPSEEQLAELKHRYELIGGHFPLREKTAAQIKRIESVLDTHEDRSFVVVQGSKHAAPFVEDSVAEIVSQGVDEIVGVVLSPHRSKSATDQYHQRAEQKCSELGATYLPIRSWATLPEFIEFEAKALQESLDSMEGTPQVAFTAHSLPEASLVDDVYEQELAESAQAIAQRCGLPSWGRWATAWQSAGQTGMAWAGPDICEVIEELASTGRSDGLIVVPQGFSSDHLEVLYDLEILAAQTAADLGLPFARAATVNDDPGVMGGIARLIIEAPRNSNK